MHAHTYIHAQTNPIDSELVKKNTTTIKGKKKVASIWQNKLGVQDGEELRANSESELLWLSLRET